MANNNENTFLSRFAVNLNERASAGKLDPVIGRDDEIRRVLQILSRRTKNNPILVGEPGVGWERQPTVTSPPAGKEHLALTCITIQALCVK